jgi:hypothetical protein
MYDVDTPTSVSGHVGPIREPRAHLGSLHEVGAMSLGIGRPLYWREVSAMTRAAVVRYHTTTVSTERNRRLIEDVLVELAARDPGGLHYQVFGFDDGFGFMHVAVFDGAIDPFAECTAYREFHRELRDRLAAPPIVIRAVLIGSYP